MFFEENNYNNINISLVLRPAGQATSIGNNYFIKVKKLLLHTNFAHYHRHHKQQNT
jgi:hypothetical protein